MRFSVSTVLIVLFLGGCGKESGMQLVQVDSEREANRIMVVLAEADVNGCEMSRVTEQRKSVYRISAEPQHLNRARAVLEENDLPREREAGFEAMLKTSGLVPTASEERAKLMYATSGELERTLELYDRVISARVHIVLPNPEAMSASQAVSPSATVLIKLRPGSPSPATQPSASVPSTNEIAELVAGAIGELKPEDVKVKWTVANSRSNTAMPGRGISSASTSRSGSTVVTLVVVVAMLLLTLLVVTLQLFKANRELTRFRGRVPA